MILHAGDLFYADEAAVYACSPDGVDTVLIHQFTGVNAEYYATQMVVRLIQGAQPWLAEQAREASARAHRVHVELAKACKAPLYDSTREGF